MRVCCESDFSCNAIRVTLQDVFQGRMHQEMLFE